MGRVSEGDSQRAAFERLFDAHYAELERFVRRRLSDQSAAEDVLTETFLVAWRRSNEVPEPAVPWLYRVCSHVLATHQRAASRRRRLFGRMAALPTEETRDLTDALAERETIAEAFADLSEDQREVLRLIVWEGLSTAEAAEVLDCTPGAFRIRFMRARQALAKHLELAGNEGTRSPVNVETR
jgi:RNA polymerase sigma-70 factor (ECF subfamily)